METSALLETIRPQPPPLETSLVEWKHSPGPSVGQLAESLETSFVEWKQELGAEFDKLDEKALETSLVEWKLYLQQTKAMTGHNLGNFLSGMET